MLKYEDERDKSYGVAGMAIALRIWNADDMYGSVSLDAEGFDCIHFSGEYFYTQSSEGISPRIAFRHSVKVYKVMMGMAISNALCRSIIGKGERPMEADMKEILQAFTDEGEAQYAITASECRTLFEKSYNYLNRLYTYGNIKSNIDRLTEALLRERSLNQLEISDFIGALGQ